MLVYDARSLTVSSQKKLSADSTVMTNCGEHIWVGDKKGDLRIYDHQLTEVKHLAGVHSKAVSAITSNGKLVASGDAYRYVFIHDGATHEKVLENGDQKDKILEL